MPLRKCVDNYIVKTSPEESAKISENFFPTIPSHKFQINIWIICHKGTKTSSKM